MSQFSLFDKSRNEEMLEQMLEFHKNHPEVWDYFRKFAFQMIRVGYDNYSAKAVMERIRWEKDAGGDGQVIFKLNNNYTAFYARMFHDAYPSYRGFFRTRTQISKAKPATNLPELGPTDFA